MNYAEQKVEVEKTKFERIIETEKFKELINQKKKFLIPYTVFFLLFYFALPVMTSYTKLLHQPAFGDINWAWIFAIAQFVMTWTLVTIYMKRSSTFDKLAAEATEEFVKQGESK